VPIPQKNLSRVFRTAPAKAVLAVGGAALASGALLAFPATASAASDSANRIIRPSHFPSFSSPAPPPTTQFPTPGNSAIVPVSNKKSAAPTQSTQGQFSYVSTFSPAPIASSAPPNTASVSCLANGQPVSGPGGDLDLPGISGTSKDAGHAGALPINTLGPTTMLPPQIDSANLGQLTVTRPVDATSTNLSMVASSGYRFPCVHIEVGAGQGFANAEYALANAGLVADDRSGTTETLTWTYSTILWSYTLPGSTAVHQGSGQINAQPDRTKNSLVKDSKAVAAGTIGLTLVVSLGLITLYIVGKRRNRARYRARYYRRAALRAQREAMATGGFSPMLPAEPVAPAETWEPQPGEAFETAESVRPVETEAVEDEEAEEALEAAETVEAAEAVEPEGAEPLAPVEQVETEPEAESTESDVAESEPETETEAESTEHDAAESESASEPEAESTESDVAESEPELEAERESEPAEPELAEPELAEPELAEPEAAEPELAKPEAAEPEPEAEVGEATEPTDSGQPSEAEVPTKPVEASDSADAGESEESSAPDSKPASGDKHEPAAAH
jgi:type VI protein secretion system component Hcp